VPGAPRRFRTRARSSFKPLEPDYTDLPTPTPIVNEILHFGDCCRTGEEPTSSGRDNLETMKTIFGIFESSRTGKAVDRIDGISVTCVDNGMPVVVMRASDFGKTGYESPGELEQDEALKSRVESIRIQAGPMMNLGDVTGKTVPKMSLVAPPRHGGVVATRTFIPHRVHQSIGVLGAASVAAACCVTESVVEGVTDTATGGEMDIEHPTGRFTVDIGISKREGCHVITRSALLRTARKLMDGTVYIPQGAAVC